VKMKSLPTLGASVESYGTLGTLVVLLAVNAILTPHFVSWSNLWNVGRQVTTTIWVAMGMTFVIATRGIDLSVGSIMALSSVVLSMLLPAGILAALGGALAVGTMVGFVNGFLVTRLGILPIIVTLATAISLRGVAQILVEGSPIVAFENSTLDFIGNGRLGVVPFQVGLTAIAFLAARVGLRRTVFGRHVLAVGGNAEAARLAGVSVAWVVGCVYAISGSLAAIAGIIETARLSATDAGRIGQDIELDAIAATVIGGTPLGGGRAVLGGTILGCFVLGLVTSGMNMLLVPYAWTMVLKALIVLAAASSQARRERHQ
jgi:ribose/xylose/arabinose/galactoside ABC-type transport system permease subunit